jgi:hypothetical protein
MASHDNRAVPNTIIILRNHELVGVNREGFRPMRASGEHRDKIVHAETRPAVEQQRNQQRRLLEAAA